MVWLVVSLHASMSMADLAVFVRKVQLYTMDRQIDWAALEKRVLVPLAGISAAVWQQAASWGILVQAPATVVEVAADV